MAAASDIAAYWAGGGSTTAIRQICSRIGDLPLLPSRRSVTCIHRVETPTVPAPTLCDLASDSESSIATECVYEEAVEDFVGMVMSFTKSAALPGPKAALVLNLAVDVMRSSSQCSLDDSFAMYKEKVLDASGTLSVEEIGGLTEFLTRTYFAHHHLYHYALASGQQEDVEEIHVKLETPMSWMALSRGAAAPTGLDWVERGTVWQGLLGGMLKLDAYCGSEGSQAREDELRDTHAWMKQLKDLLKQACGPYTALPKSSKDEALLQLGALETWLKNGAPDRPKERVEEPTDETPAEPTEDDVAQEEAPTEVINGVEMGVWIVQLRRLEFWVAVELAKALLAGLLQKLTKWKLENGEGIELPCEIGDGETEQIVLRILKHALALLSQAADWDACWTSAVETVVSDLGVVVLKGKAASETMLREWLSTLEMLTSAPSAEEEAAAEEDVDAEEEAAAEEDVAPEEEKEAEPELSQEELAQQEALRRQQEAEAQLLAAQQLILSMRSKIAELKGYSVEPANSQVLRGVFELLGDAHKDIKSWGDCRKRLGADLFTRITEFDASVKPMKRLAAVSKIKSSIEGVEQAAVNTSSEALGGMYTWLTAALEAIEAAASASVTAESENPEEMEGSEANVDEPLLEDLLQTIKDEKLQTLLQTLDNKQGDKLREHFDPKLATMKGEFIPAEE